MSDLLDYQALQQLLNDELDAAEIHGVICGLICVNNNTGQSAMLLLRSLYQQLATDARTETGLQRVLDASALQLDDPEMGFDLMLPDDGTHLSRRTDGLAHWCSGFLLGVGTVGDERVKQFPENTREALKDIAEIARAGLAPDVEASDEDENAYMEVTEYLRVVTLLIREELRGPEAGDRLH